MSLRRPFASYNLRTLFLVIHSRFCFYSRLKPNNVLQDDVRAQREKHSFNVNQGLQYLISRNSDLQNEHSMKIGRNQENGAILRSLGPASTPSRPKPPHYPSWGRWILGLMLSLILPFWNNKWEKLQKIEDEVEMVAEVVENAAEVVETVATVSENLSTMAAENIPDGKLKDAALFVKHVSEEAVKDAQLTEDFIRKVDELKQEAETLIKPITEKELQQAIYQKQQQNCQR